MEARNRTGSILSPSSARASRGRSAWPGADFASAGRRQKGRPSRSPPGAGSSQILLRPRLWLKIQPQLFPKVCASYIYPLPAEIIVRVVLRLSRKTPRAVYGIGALQGRALLLLFTAAAATGAGSRCNSLADIQGSSGSCMPLRNSVLRFRSTGRTRGAFSFVGEAHGRSPRRLLGCLGSLY